ncbi:XRE family transcriptional regulator [Streptomyces sp. NWU339]|uniref:telomere-protecting terminal protein Tpg n=1 Tax=Streptomyces sp. NWU339 TaxID=2185284 RepID=UPI00215A8BE8|nr:XRE family transcriptional regulator [Streptomyces sp. NWU339]
MKLLQVAACPSGADSHGLERAVQQAFTRPIPKSAGAQMRYLVKQLKGTRAVADALGITQRTVERYIKDQIRRPRADLAQRLQDAVRARRQPRIRAQARKQAATSTGLVVDTRARFGFTVAPGTTDDARVRHLTLALPPQHAARLFAAQETGASERRLCDIAPARPWAPPSRGPLSPARRWLSRQPARSSPS